MKSTNPILRASVLLLLGLTLLAPAQELPQDLTAISPAQAIVLQDLGRLYKFSSYVPGSPPLPPGILAGALEDGSANATNLFYSASLGAILWDDRETVTLDALQAALSADQRMYQQEEEEEESELPPLDTSGLYLAMTSVADGLASLNLWNGTNFVYAIQAAPTPTGPWSVVTELFPTNGEVLPFTVSATGDQVFLRAMDWSGVIEQDIGNTAVPNWWLWMYFGTILPETNLDTAGNTLLADYQDQLPPANDLSFNVSTTNTYLTQPNPGVPLQLDLLAGLPGYYAILVNDPNPGDAVWQPYAGTNLTVAIGPTDGVYTVSVALRPFPASASPAWQTLILYLDTTPLRLGLTNLPSLSGSRPFIDPAGYASRALSALNWTLIDATGATNTGSGMVVAQDWNPSDPWHATNWLQCVDLPLALGTNWVSIQATDWAGAVAVTNFAYVFGTSGDTNAPALSLVWPPAGASVSGESFTVQATTDDDTAAVALQYYDGDGILQTVIGIVERGGRVWGPSVPLGAGTNHLSLLATDAAGHVSTNTLTVVQSTVGLTISPLSQDDLKYAYVTVHGTVDDLNSTVTVNGVTAENDDGEWTAHNVPLELGGTVTLQATALLGGAQVQRMVTQERGPIVFTQTYDYKLDYTFNPTTNTVGGRHFELHWARGVGGTEVETAWTVNAQGTVVSSNVTIVTWPPDNGYWPSLEGQLWYASYADGVLTDTFDWTADPPSVEWMEKSSSAGSRPYLQNQTWSKSSSRGVGLFTGGNASRQSQGLFDLSASLTCESVVPANISLWLEQYTSPEFRPFLSPATPPVGVPPEQIALGAEGKLGSDGHRWAVRSNGKEIVITPTAPAVSYTGGLPSALRYNPCITLSTATTNVSLATNTPEVCVGQQVTFTLNGLPTYDQQVGHWILPQKYVNHPWQLQEWLVTIPPNGYWAPYGSTNYDINPDLLTNLTTQCWYFNKPGGKVTAAWNLQFANGQQVLLITRGALTVSRPTVSLVQTSVHGTPDVEWGWTWWYNFPWGYQAKLQVGTFPVTNYMDYKLRITSPDFAGLTKFTQLCSRNASFSITTNVVNWLDNEDPYNDTFNILKSPNPTGSMCLMELWDSPSATGYGRVFMYDTYPDYVMFTPNGAGDIYVPLGKLVWNVSGDATYPSTDINPSSVTGPTAPDGSDDWPVRSQVYYNGVFFH